VNVRMKTRSIRLHAAAMGTSSSTAKPMPSVTTMATPASTTTTDRQIALTGGECSTTEQEGDVKMFEPKTTPAAVAADPLSRLPN